MNIDYGECSMIEFIVITSISVMSLFLYSIQSQIEKQTRNRNDSYCGNEV